MDRCEWLARVEGRSAVATNPTGPCCSRWDIRATTVSPIQKITSAQDGLLLPTIVTGWTPCDWVLPVLLEGNHTLHVGVTVS